MLYYSLSAEVSYALLYEPAFLLAFLDAFWLEVSPLVFLLPQFLELPFWVAAFLELPCVVDAFLELVF